MTVRAQIQAITVAMVPSSSLAFGYRWPMRRSASSRIHFAIAADVLGQALGASPAQLRFRVRVNGCLSAHFGGISISALLMSTATGFRSLACASRPSRWASSGIDPPPANGSRIGGGLPSQESQISLRAAASTSSLRSSPT